MGGGNTGGSGGGGGGGLAGLLKSKQGGGKFDISDFKDMAPLFAPNRQNADLVSMMGGSGDSFGGGDLERLFGGFNPAAAPEPIIEEEGLNEPEPIDPNRGRVVNAHRPTLMPSITPTNTPQYGRR